MHICYHSSSQLQPLGAEKDDKKFKVFFFDIGIALRLQGNIDKEWILQPLNTKNSGHITEQFVAQELMAYNPTSTKRELFYWHREAKSSNAEVDFVITKDGAIIPVEVKAGKFGSLKSLHYFLDCHPHSNYGLKISEQPSSKQEKLVEIPLYGIEAWLS